MNSSICIHVLKINEVEKLEYAFFSELTEKGAPFTIFHTIFVLKSVLDSVYMNILRINI